MRWIDRLWPNRPTPLQDKAQELIIKAFGGVMLASFLGTLLALKGCG